MNPLATSLLVVRQGRALARAARAGDATLDWIRRHDPALSGRILVHETGTGALPAVAAAAGAVVLWLPANLRDRYPAQYREAAAITELALRRGAPVVNPAPSLANGGPAARAAIWEQAGVPCAAPRRYRSRAELEKLLKELPAPVVVRPDWTQTVHFASTTAAAIGAAIAGWQCTGTVTPFVDTREAPARRDPAGVWAQLHHRKRAFVCGDVVVPGEVLFSTAPLVRPGVSTFARYTGWRALLQGLAYLRRLEREAVAADLEFAQAPEHAPFLLQAVRALDLQCAAIDYSTGADGRPIVWSADPCPDLNGWPSAGMPLVRRAGVRLHRIHAAVAALLRGLIHDSIAQRRTA